MAGEDVVLDAATAAELHRRERLAFVDGAAAYQAAMAEGGRADRAALLALAALEADLHLLDVCTGPGWLAIEAVQQCPGLTAHGVDLSEAMVELARTNAANVSLPVEFTVMDAARLDLPDASVDRITCGWGLMHVPDPTAVLAEMARVVRRGGRLAASVWGPAEQTVQGLLAAALRTGANGRAAMDYGYVTRLGDENLLAELLEQAGWSEARFEQRTVEMVLPNAELVWTGMSHGTTFGTLVADLTPQDQVASKAAFISMCEERRRGDGIGIPFSQLLATARR